MPHPAPEAAEALALTDFLTDFFDYPGRTLNAGELYEPIPIQLLGGRKDTYQNITLYYVERAVKGTMKFLV